MGHETPKAKNVKLEKLSTKGPIDWQSMKAWKAMPKYMEDKYQKESS